MKNRHIIITLSLSALLSSIAFGASASNMTFSGQNPAIFNGANPANASVLLAGVNRPKDPKLSTGISTLSPASIVEQSVLSQASANINNTIFHSNPGDSGTFNLGGGTSISYTNIAGVISLTVTDSHGTTVIGGF